MPMRQFKKTKRVITAEERLTMHEQALANAESLRQATAEKERLVAEGKLRKVVLHPDPKTTIIRYEPVSEP